MVIWDHPIAHRVQTGLDYGVLLPDCVPIFEEREAAVYCHYTPTAYQALPLEERAACVAQYRIHQLIETHVSDAVNKAVELEAAKQRRR